MYKKFFKRFFDIVFSFIAIPFFLILLTILAPLIYFSDKGSIFYNAPRLGKDGKVFKMYKFRTMKMNSPDIRNEDGSTFNSENDSRLTKIGKLLRKTSIDEIPQILNVFNGDMSFIGPRPTMSNLSVEDYPKKYTKRFNVRPGITGYTQAYFRNSITQDEQFSYDVLYSEEISLYLDIKIFFKTIISILNFKNINRK